jgi:hypothetical protein
VNAPLGEATPLVWVLTVAILTVALVFSVAVIRHARGPNPGGYRQRRPVPPGERMLPMVSRMKSTMVNAYPVSPRVSEVCGRDLVRVARAYGRRRFGRRTPPEYREVLGLVDTARRRGYKAGDVARAINALERYMTDKRAGSRD